MKAAKVEKKIRGIFQRPPGSGIWWISYQRDGVRKREKVGRKGDAIELYRIRKTELRTQEKLPQNLRHRGITFEKIAADALAYSAKHHKDTRNIRQRLNALSAAFGGRVAASIKPSEIDEWLTRNTTTAATANRYRAAFSLVFREAIKNGDAPSNPARLVTQRKEGNGRIRFLTASEELILRAAIMELCPRRLPEFVISTRSGMRLSEQYGLVRKDIDLSAGVIDLTNTKNGDPRMIPMSMEVKRSFETLLASSNHGPNDRVFDLKTPRKWWNEVTKRAGMENYHWHDNRHTFCSRLAANKENLKTIQQLAGHRTIITTARYTHMDDDVLRNAIRSLD